MTLLAVFSDPVVADLLASESAHCILVGHLNQQLCLLAASKKHRTCTGFETGHNPLLERYGTQICLSMSEALKDGMGWSGDVLLPNGWTQVRLWKHGIYGLIQEQPQHLGNTESQSASPETTQAPATEPEIHAGKLEGSVLLQLDMQGCIVAANHHLRAFLEVGSDELQGIRAEHLVHPADRTSLRRALTQLTQQTDTLDMWFRLRNIHGQVAGFDWTAARQGAGIMLVGKGSKARLEQALVKSEERIHRILESIDDAFFAMDQHGTVSYVNAQGAEFLGVQASNLQGQLLWNKVPRLKKSPLFGLLHRENAHLQAENFQWEDPQTERWFQVKTHPSDDLITVFLADITELKHQENKARHEALHDALTNLPNRRALINSLTDLIENQQVQGFKMALLFIDLDGFKSVNDTLGHDNGDDLLKQVATRLCAVVRHSDIVARLSGDEFVVALPAIESPEDASAVGKKIVDVISNSPFALGGEKIYVGASVGISLFHNSVAVPTPC
ncbi:MAG: diguanylate cyclase [Limnobacter sp.]|nr:diguanylate cyclase [Limnobacter sp.]